MNTKQETMKLIELYDCTDTIACVFTNTKIEQIAIYVPKYYSEYMEIGKDYIILNRKSIMAKIHYLPIEIDEYAFDFDKSFDFDGFNEFDII